MKSNAPEVIEFNIPMFCEKILICVSPNMDIIKELFPKEDLPDTNNSMGYAFSAMHKDGNSRMLIWVRNWHLPTLLHEIYHTVFSILDYMGVNDTETGAYMLEYIYTEMVRQRSINRKSGSSQCS